MNVIILSDIHANYEALKSLRPYLEEADQILCLGDIIGYYCQVNEVIDYLKELNAFCILGNHDAFLFNGCPDNLSAEVKFGIRYANSVITSTNRQWLSKLPISWSGYIDKISFLMVHGSPWDPFGDYLYANNPKLQMLDSFNYDVIAFGQTHRGLIKTNQKPYIINPGSVGQSRDKNMMACAVAMDTNEMSFKLIESSYDTSNVIKLLNDNHAGDKATKYLLPKIETELG